MPSVLLFLVRPMRARVLLYYVCFLWLGGCASANQNPADPLEPMNRVIYKFNTGLDKIIIRPVAQTYKDVLPQFVRTGVTNFFNNLYDVLVALNDMLEGKLPAAASDVGRIVVNTTVGVGGLIDVGTKIGLEKHIADFGLTLGHWGINDGPYLQVPLFGPSSFRDSVGRFVDFEADPVYWLCRYWLRDHNVATRNSLWALNFVNTRANLLDATNLLEKAALDPYEFQRDAYLQRRRSLLYDGNPPPPKDDSGNPPSKLDEDDQSGQAGGAAPNAVTPTQKAPAGTATVPASP